MQNELEQLQAAAEKIGRDLGRFKLIFRPHAQNHFIECISNTLFSVSREFSIICIVGDFNFPSIDWSNVHNVNPDLEFVQLMHSYGFQQHNNIKSNVYGHVLDLIFSNADIIYGICDLPSDSFPSDHTVLLFNLCVKMPKLPTIKRWVYDYKRADLNDLCSALFDADLMNVILNADNVDEMWSLWFGAITSVIDHCVPKFVVRNSNEPPWFDAEMRHLMNCKKTAWRRAKQLNSETAWARFRTLRNRVKSALKTKYAAFIESLESTCKQNPKRFWTFFKSKTKTRALPSVLCDENTECIHARDKAHLFNNYFAQVFNDDSETVIPLYDGAEVPSIVVPCFTTDDIKSVLKSLNVNKACAPGDVSQLVLKKCCDVLASAHNRSRKHNRLIGPFAD